MKKKNQASLFPFSRDFFCGFGPAVARTHARTHGIFISTTIYFIFPLLRKTRQGDTDSTLSPARSRETKYESRMTSQIRSSQRIKLRRHLWNGTCWLIVIAFGALQRRSVDCSAAELRFLLSLSLSFLGVRK